MHIHSILSRPLFLDLTCEFVQIFITFNKIDVSLFKKLTSKYGKRIVLICLFTLYKVPRMSSFSHSFIAVFLLSFVSDATSFIYSLK